MSKTITELENLLIKHLWEDCDFPSGVRFDFSVVSGGYLEPAQVKGAELTVGQWKGVFGSLVKKEYIEHLYDLNDLKRFPVFGFTKAGRKLANKLSKRRFNGEDETKSHIPDPSPTMSNYEIIKSDPNYKNLKKVFNS